MGKSLKVRFEEKGIPKGEIAHAILQRGLLPVADERGCTFEALKNYAEKELGISGAPLVNQDYIKTNHVLSRELIFALFDMWKEIEADNQRLREELGVLRREEEKKDALAKVQLLEMLDAVRTPAPARA